jgi:phosphate:Na+ symporter
MAVMTEGLGALAGDAVRAALMRFTRSPVSGAVTGVATTALLQSSSATTVAAVGFVGAGLIGFPDALGIIFGANIGTTVTGWLVALLGFKPQLGALASPLVFVGAVLRLFGRGRMASIGYALAGFGLIFVGITVHLEQALLAAGK